MFKNKIGSLFLVIFFTLFSLVGYASTTDDSNSSKKDIKKHTLTKKEYMQLLKVLIKSAVQKGVGVICLAGTVYFFDRAIKEGSMVKNKLVYSDFFWVRDFFLAYGFVARVACVSCVRSAVSGLLGVVCLYCGVQNLKL